MKKYIQVKMETFEFEREDVVRTSSAEEVRKNSYDDIVEDFFTLSN